MVNMRKATLPDEYRCAYENHELAKARLRGEVFGFINKCKFDDAMVAAKFGRIVYGGSLIGDKNDRKINSRIYNGFRYDFGNLVDSLLVDIEESRRPVLRQDSHAAHSNTPSLEVSI